MTAKPRLVVAITLAGVGGAQAYVAALLPALIRDYDVVVAAHGDGPLRHAAEHAGARFVSLRWVRRSLGPLDVAGLAELVALCRQERPVAVLLNSSKVGLLGRVAAAIARVPVRVFTVHGWAFAAHTGIVSTLYLWAERLVAPLTTLFICPAAHERDVGVAVGACKAERTLVIPNAVDVGSFPVAEPTSAPAVILSVGRLHFPKDFPTLIQALATLEPGSFRALLVGEGPERSEIEGEIDRLGLGADVKLLGARDDVPQLLATADVFVLSSSSECLPISIIEAMAAGLPVVASEVGGVAELMTADTGLLVPAGDATALSRALGEITAHPEQRERMGAAARRRALDRFDLPRFRDAHLDALRQRVTAAR